MDSLYYVDGGQIAQRVGAHWKWLGTGDKGAEPCEVLRAVPSLGELIRLETLLQGVYRSVDILGEECGSNLGLDEVQQALAILGVTPKSQ
jgi:hypothetical protein